MDYMHTSSLIISRSNEFVVEFEESYKSCLFGQYDFWRIDAVLIEQHPPHEISCHPRSTYIEWKLLESV